MDINGKEFRELVIHIIEQVLQEQRRSRQKLYVIFEDFFDVRAEEFLRMLTDSYEVYAIVPDEWKGNEVLQRLRSCQENVKIVLRSDSSSVSLEGALTVYPVASRAFIAKAALGMDDTFTVQWLVRCMEQGTPVWLLSSGLSRFTGREPAPYVERILGYYRTLLTYGIVIASWKDLQTEPVVTTQQGVPVEVPAYQIGAGPVTASDLAALPAGCAVKILPGTVITDMARDRAAAKHIRFV